jgi:zinc transport system substrate-binding protein
VNSRTAWICACGIITLGVAGCASDSTNSQSTGAGGTEIEVIASFYPLQYVVERIGGDLVHVRNLTPAGAEPHDLEITADDTARMQDADLVVYLSGFSPAVDDTVDAVARGHAFDAAAFADLTLTYTPIEEGESSDEQVTDPHFWLDPTRLANVADQIAGRLAELDTTKSDTFVANAGALRRDLESLDHGYANGLANCANGSIVTSHNAFGYLADRYGLTQVGITGLTPEDEPSPQDLAAVTDFVKDHDVTTIYYETLVSPDIAETVAAETGAAVDVLDPIEGLSDTSRGADYPAIMRSNLETLRRDQHCA